jgi:hypothetical protein
VQGVGLSARGIGVGQRVRHGGGLRDRDLVLGRRWVFCDSCSVLNNLVLSVQKLGFRVQGAGFSV